MKFENPFSTKLKRTDLMKWLRSMLLKELFTNSCIWAIPKRSVFKNSKEVITYGKEKRT